MRGGTEGTTEAAVSLFGRTATLVVPTGRDNVADLLEIFAKLDTSLSELKQENKVRGWVWVGGEGVLVYHLCNFFIYL